MLEETNSKIIISSDWSEEKYPYMVRDFLRIHNLDEYWFIDNIINKEFIDYPKRRALEIEDSLNKFPIKNYVVLDDMVGLKSYFPNNTVKTYNYLTEDNAKEAKKILTLNK